ncbi:MAG: hypothetical protein ACNA78_01435 [Balneolaceae bacterium]
MQTITGVLPVQKMKSNNKSALPNSTNGLRQYSGPSLLQQIVPFVAILLLLGFASACSEEGIVGSGLDNPSVLVDTSIVQLTSITEVSDNGFSGRLPSSAMGKVNDPTYGTIEAAALLRPSIATDLISTFNQFSDMKLRLVFERNQYGDTTSVSSFNIYEIDELWRGNQIRVGETVAMNTSQLLGSFEVSPGQETAEVELDESWVQRYREFFMDTSDDRIQNYRDNFPGLAIVPDGDNNRLHFLRHLGTGSDGSGTGEVTAFVAENPDTTITGDLQMLDFASSIQRINEPEPENDSFVLHNTLERLLKINLDLAQERFQGVNISNAQLLLFVNDGVDSDLPNTFVRPLPNTIRVHLFNRDPLNVHADIFVQQPTVTGVLNAENNFYQLNFTNILIARLFTDNQPDLYLSVQNQDGLLYSTTFFNENAPFDKTPKLIVTTVNADN